MAQFSLFFFNEVKPTLIETRFEHPISGSRQCVRGKTGGAYSGYGCFQWTSAVSAMTSLALQSAAYQEGQKIPLLLGERSSPASSLDYSLSKLPVWVLDMFGTDSRGRAIAQRLFRRSNPERKRPGPVIISINSHELSPKNIKVYLNNQQITDSSKIHSMIERMAFAGEDRRIETAPELIALAS